jgi:hypothetical protein
MKIFILLPSLLIQSCFLSKYETKAACVQVINTQGVFVEFNKAEICSEITEQDCTKKNENENFSYGTTLEVTYTWKKGEFCNED